VNLSLSIKFCNKHFDYLMFHFNWSGKINCSYLRFVLFGMLVQICRITSWSVMLNGGWSMGAGSRKSIKLSHWFTKIKTEKGGRKKRNYMKYEICVLVYRWSIKIFIYLLSVSFVYKYYGCLPSKNFVGTCQRQIQVQ